MLKAEGLSIKRGLLLSGPPGDGKSTAIECFVNDIAGEATHHNRRGGRAHPR